MDSYYSMEMAAEVRAQQLLAEAEHRRLVRGIESAPRPSVAVASLRARVAAFHRLHRVAGTVDGDRRPGPLSA